MIITATLGKQATGMSDRRHIVMTAEVAKVGPPRSVQFKIFRTNTDTVEATAYIHIKELAKLSELLYTIGGTQ
jgi:hypothetical protein